MVQTKQGRPLQRLNKYFWKYRSLLFLGSLFVVLSNVFSVYVPIYVREAFDKLAIYLKPGHTATNSSPIGGILLYYSFLILGTAIIRGVFMYYMRQTLIVMSRHVEYDLKNEIYNKYQELDMAFYRSHSTGDLMNRISEDVGRVRMYVGPAVLYAVNLVAMFAVVLFCMFSVDTELAFWALAPLPVLAVSIFFVNNLIEKRSDEMQSKLSDITSFVQEAFSGLRVIKAFAKEKNIVQAFEGETENYRKKTMASALVDALWFPAIVLLIGLSNILVIYVGGLKVISGQITIGNIAEFIIYLNMLSFPVTALGWVASIRQRAKASQLRINEFLQIKPDITSQSDAPFVFEKEIVFEHVQFSYVTDGKQVLGPLSFKLQKGGSLGIVGTTGSGKSTVASLLLRLYDVSSGQLLVDGKNINEINLEAWRTQIGYVPQDVFLFSDSIANNIAFGTSATLSQNELEQAAKDAALWGNIENFPQGMETMLGERGITLSGGQKQRLSIARAILGNPEILVLDDCLSAMDTETEHQILANLNRLKQGRTSVIISHRISSVMACNEILVLENGQVAERGNHQQLLELNGRYQSIYEKQMREEKSNLEIR